MSWLRTGVTLRSWIVLVLIALPLNLAFAEPEPAAEQDGHYDYIGRYFRTGIVAGFFEAHQSSVDFDPGVGIGVSLGYRVNAYFAGEIDFTYIFESDTDDFTKLEGVEFDESDDSKNLDYYELTINLKGYPLGYFEVPEVPDWIQPYGKFGVGISDADVGYLDEIRFSLRFGAGVDFMVSDRFGLYLDGGYSVITQAVREGKYSILDGHGQLGLGGLVRF